jgi:hypothetical protein
MWTGFIWLRIGVKYRNISRMVMSLFIFSLFNYAFSVAQTI